MSSSNKYEPIVLPTTRDEAEERARDYELWANEARRADRFGSAQHLEFTASVLRRLGRFLP